MPFVRMDDNYASHPKITKLSDAAFRLHTSAICHANRYRTDGYIAAVDVRRLVPTFRRRALVELVDANLWVEHDDGAGFDLHDFLDWNDSRAAIDKQRAANAAKQRAWRARKEEQ